MNDPASARRGVIAVRNIAGAHVHMAYSSHICPKYPKFASRTPRLRNTLVICVMSNGWLGSAYGPSRRINTSAPPITAKIEVHATFTRQLDEPMALTR